MNDRTPIAPQPRSDPAAPPGRRLPHWPIILLYLALLSPLALWGLPSRRDDARLFGGFPAWTAERYAAESALHARRERVGGADTDLNPLARRDALVDLTPDESARAEILRRYRLFSRQPDEMITFMALQRMRPRQLDFDPRLYQYGGAYIYLIGATIGLTSLLGVTTLTGDAGVYLSDPDLFARFYVVARVVSLVFAGLMLIGVGKLARRAAGSAAGWIAILALMACPVFISGALEAKPHLPSAGLVIWATLSALRYRTRGQLVDALHLGIRIGLAAGLVLTGVVAAPLLLVFLPTLQRLPARADLLRRHCALAILLAGGTYALTNPFVLLNALRQPAALLSNLSNSTAMYGVSPMGAPRVGALLLESGGWLLPIVGAIGVLVLLARHRAAGLVSFGPPALLLLICVFLGTGKPAEFARFLLLPTAFLAIAAAALLAPLCARRWWVVPLVGLALASATSAPAYLDAFRTDAQSQAESRRRAADYLLAALPAGAAIGVVQEPAPYALPPLDFATRRVLLLPAAAPPPQDRKDLPAWLVLTADDERAFARAWWRDDYRLVRQFPQSRLGPAQITWANKPVFVFARASPR